MVKDQVKCGISKKKKKKKGKKCDMSQSPVTLGYFSVSSSAKWGEGGWVRREASLK